VDIHHLPDDHRFEVRLGGAQTARLEYYLRPEARPTTLTITHTYVPRAFEGRGIASQLTQAALDHAQREGLEVIPLCSFAVTYLARRARRTGPS
jgi:uncharacterized protein